MINKSNTTSLAYKAPGSFEETRYEKLHNVIVESSTAGSIKIAHTIAELIAQKKVQNEMCVLGLATGSSPLSVYRELVRLHKEEGLSFQNVITFNLDEYFPLSKDDVQSYHYFMHSNLFDHVDIHQDLMSWHQKISYIPQTIAFIDDTIKKNIALGATKVDEKKLSRCVQDAQLEEFVLNLPDGLDTKIGYLSCDIEPPKNTFAALKRVIEQGVEFECITFEHDWYNYQNTNFNQQATDFLTRHGYKVAVHDVYFKKPWLPYETWFVRQDNNFTPVNFQQWCIEESKHGKEI